MEFSAEEKKTIHRLFEKGYDAPEKILKVMEDTCFDATGVSVSWQDSLYGDKSAIVIGYMYGSTRLVVWYKDAGNEAARFVDTGKPVKLENIRMA